MGAGERNVMPDLRNMNGFVTAAGSGIGRASAIAFARAGAKVLVTDLVAAAVAGTCAAIRAAGGTAAGPSVEAPSGDGAAAVAGEARSTRGRARVGHSTARPGQ